VENNLILSEIKISGNTAEYIYSVIGEWKKFFMQEESFFITYDFTLETVPKSVLAIPFLCNVLPISWIVDAEIKLDEIDKDFLESIPEFKRGYIDMYPMINFSGSINARSIIDNAGERAGCASLFSGGADATHTMISHIDEKPALLCIWGADIKLEDEKGWERVNEHLANTAKDFGLNCTAVKTSFRKILNEYELSRAVSISGDGWWHGFQHGIALISHAAPYMHIKGLKTLYIASSFKASAKVTGASYYTIDNHVRFCGSNVIYDAPNHSRQDKVAEICSYINKTGTKVNLRVCWEKEGGGNCCRCEKCIRTMLNVAAEGSSPADYGFTWNRKTIRNIKYYLLWVGEFPRWEERYGPIIERMRETAFTYEQRKQWHWLISRTPEQLATLFRKKIRKFIRKPWYLAKRIIKKVIRRA
jgi:hypothetical protein